MNWLIRSNSLIALALCGAMFTQPALASVVFDVTGVWSDGGTLSGTFTTSDNLLGLEATSLIVAGGTNGLDSVNFNDASYITAGSNNLPDAFLLNAVSSVTKTLGLRFLTSLSTGSTTLLSGASVNSQAGVFGRVITSGSVTPRIASSPVPEPTTWAMMLFGFAVVSFAMRRQRGVTTRFGYSA